MVGGIHGLFTNFRPKYCKKGLQLVTICNTMTMVSGGGDAAHHTKIILGGNHNVKSTRTGTGCHHGLQHGYGI